MTNNNNTFITKLLSILKITILNLIIIIYMIGCNVSKYFISKDLNIEQGIYLTQKELKKIQIGQTKTKILENLGPPILQDLFEIYKWYYVYYYRTNNQIKFQTVELIFNANDILTAMNIIS